MRNHFQVDNLDVYIHPDRKSMGADCAKQACGVMRRRLEEKDELNIIFASAPSQDALFEALANEPGIAWDRVNAFHMDEYIGVGVDQPQSFANYLKDGFFSQVSFKNVFYMDGLAEDPEAECKRYRDLLVRYPTDIAFMGIGENGHIAFNDPHIADFFDPDLVIVNGCLDAKCREQQVADGWFESIGEVPGSAITVSVYGLLKAPYIFTTVPGIRKAEIVRTCLEGLVCTECPATAIRLHRNSKLFLDADSSSLLCETLLKGR